MRCLKFLQWEKIVPRAIVRTISFPSALDENSLASEPEGSSTLIISAIIMFSAYDANRFLVPPCDLLETVSTGRQG